MFAGVGLTWLLAFTALVAALGGAISRPAIRRWLQRLAGVALIAAGLRVATADAR